MSKKMKKNLEKISLEVEEPVKLSDTEQEKFKKIFGNIQSWLDEVLAGILKLDRPDAYRRSRLIVNALKQADAEFEGKPVSGPERKGTAVKRDLDKVGKTFQTNLDILTAPEAKVAETMDCVIEFNKPEIGAAVICDDCDLEKMRRCLIEKDPTIVDAMDFALSKRH